VVIVAEAALDLVETALKTAAVGYGGGTLPGHPCGACHMGGSTGAERLFFLERPSIWLPAIAAYSKGGQILCSAAIIGETGETIGGNVPASGRGVI